MKADLHELATANPITLDAGIAWALSTDAETARHRALAGELVMGDDLITRRTPRLRWPAAVVSAALVLILAVPALLFLGDEQPQTTTTTLPATTTSILEHPVPVSEEPFYTALLQCVANRYGTGFGPVMANKHGQVTAEGQAAIDRAAGTGESFSKCFADESMRNQSFDLEDGEGSILLPPDWVRTTDDLTPNFGDPDERISMGTFPLFPMTEDSDSCALQALVDLSPDDVFIQILERSGPAESFEPRPPTFAGRLSGVDENDYWECLSPAERSDIGALRWLSFETGGRGFYALVALGSEIGDDQRHTVERILDSFNVPPKVAEGWTFTEIPFTIREGSGYAAGGGRLFAWSGAPDRSGDMRRDGILVDIDTGQSRTIPDAPIEGRYLPSVVWTGTEFIVFGGHSFSESLVDGAAYDPVAGTWRQISHAPLTPAAYPAAVWNGREMVVWLAGDDSDLSGLPEPTTGQLAAYSLETDSWTLMSPPDLQIVDATLLNSGANELILVGGPNMRDLPVGGVRPLFATSFDPATETWSRPAEDSGSDSAHAFFMDDKLSVLRDDGEVRAIVGGAWESVTDLGESCWYDVGATSAGGSAYLRLCDAVYRLIGSELVPLLSPTDYGAGTGSQAFLATDDGQLVVMTDSDSEDFASGIVVFGVYDPTS